jgi:hypothetical protein
MVRKSMGAPTRSPRDAPSRTKHCNRRLTASATLPLPGAAEGWRSAGVPLTWKGGPLAPGVIGKKSTRKGGL